MFKESASGHLTKKHQKGSIYLASYVKLAVHKFWRQIFNFNFLAASVSKFSQASEFSHQINFSLRLEPTDLVSWTYIRLRIVPSSGELLRQETFSDIFLFQVLRFGGQKISQVIALPLKFFSSEMFIDTATLKLVTCSNKPRMPHFATWEHKYFHFKNVVPWSIFPSVTKIWP